MRYERTTRGSANPKPIFLECHARPSVSTVRLTSDRFLPQQILGQFRAKLFRFKKDEKQWGDMGVGQLRLMKHNTSDGRRMILRNDMGKVRVPATKDISLLQHVV